MLSALVLVSLAAGPAPPEPRSPALPWLRALPAGGDVVVFEPPGPGGRPRLALAARVNAPAARLAALLADPAAYQRALPAFVRADTKRTEPGLDAARPARQLEWELEIPLWNLTGTLWLRPRPDGAELVLLTGDLAPGRFLIQAVPDGPRAILLCEGSADVKNANWITRRLAARHALAEPAMAATAAYVLLRALALEAERPAAPRAPPRWPRTPMRAPAPAQLDGGPLARLATQLAPAAGAALAVVHSRPDGRLREVQVALASALAPEGLQARLGEHGRWQALPGWAEVEARPAGAGGLREWVVDASLPFVDFDAHWLVRVAAPFRGSIQGGDWRGAVMGWDLAPGKPGTGSATAAVFSLHPRVENTGFLPRRLIAAEPLLEQGLALGLAYVDALSLIRAAERP